MRGNPSYPQPHAPRNNPKETRSPPERTHHAPAERPAKPTGPPAREAGHALHAKKRRLSRGS